MKPESLKAPLQGVLIIDFTWVLAGPYATRLLADFGAEVIKIQSPQEEASDTYSLGYYNTWNRNKSGLCLDLSQPAAKEIIKKLARVSDVVVENFSPRVMANWNLDYDHLKAIKENIIMLSMSTMGHSNPQQNYSGFGPTVHALAGMTALTTYPGGAPEGPGFAYADHVAGLYGSLAIMGALEFRRKSGQGQYIDLSQTETLGSLMKSSMWEPELDGQLQQSPGNRSEKMTIQGVYACLGIDRWCAITITSEAEWQACKGVLGNPSWAEDKKFCNDSARKPNADELDALINKWTSQRTAEEVEVLLQAVGISASVVKNSADLINDPQLNSRGFFIHLKQSKTGDTISDASPIRLGDSPPVYKKAAPLKGQDSEYVLKDILGLAQDKIQQLKQAKVIF